MKVFTVISTLVLTSALCAYAQDQEAAEAVAKSPNQTLPCANRNEFRDFDFWLGEWDVHTANGTLAGKNRIEKAQAGCVLVENWVNTSGAPGMSINYYDISAKEWVQVWTGAGGTQIDIRGGLEENGMLLVGTIHYVANETSAPFRGLWTLLPDGRVRQFFEQSGDGGETWAPWFEGFYTRTNVEHQLSEK